jgi:single-stranded-DNA-specific exonuclease
MWQPRQTNRNNELNYLQRNIDGLLSRLLSQRDVKPDLVDDFITPKYSNLSHPHSFGNIKEAVDIFCKVVRKKGKKILITSDYDLDGIGSAHMMSELCHNLGLNCKVFLPSRIDQGYGLNPKTIEYIKKDLKETDLLFVLDSGSSSEKEIKDIKEISPNIKIIIIDHHIPDPDKLTKSADVLVNWHLSNNQETCTCGEVFHFIRGVRTKTNKVNPIEYLSFAALGILADVMPIIGDNRIIVKNGLTTNALNHITSSGLNALLRNCQIYDRNVAQEEVLFQIAPIINSSGRILTPDMSFNLLKEHNISNADKMAKELVNCNYKRKQMQTKMEKEALAIVNKNPEQYSHGILLFNPNWHIGVVGIVAAKLAEKFNKPTIVLGENEGLIKGSGRSLGDIDLEKITDDCCEMFENYGGHRAAVGITLKREYIEKANELFNKACEKYGKANIKVDDTKYYDAELKPETISLKTAKMLLKNLYPYCNKNNPEPIFLIKNVSAANTKKYTKSSSLLMFDVLKDGVQIPFKFKMFSDKYGTEIDGKNINLYFKFPQMLTEGRYDICNTAIDLEIT